MDHRLYDQYVPLGKRTQYRYLNAHVHLATDHQMTHRFDQFGFTCALVSENVQHLVNKRLAVVGTLANETKQIWIGLIQLTDGRVWRRKTI